MWRLSTKKHISWIGMKPTIIASWLRKTVTRNCTSTTFLPSRKANSIFLPTLCNRRRRRKVGKLNSFREIGSLRFLGVLLPLLLGQKLLRLRETSYKIRLSPHRISEVLLWKNSSLLLLLCISLFLTRTSLENIKYRILLPFFSLATAF